MNKTTKGALAAGAAALLLLGGAGSYALWSDSDSIAAGDITAGVLDIEGNGPGVWTDVSPLPNTPAPGVIDIATFKIVPGDVLEYAADFTVTADGDNLSATVTGVPAVGSIPVPLQPYITFDTTMEINGVPVTGTNVITEDNDGDTVDVTVAVTFSDQTPGQVGQGLVVDLSDFTVTLQQSPRG